MQKLNQFLKLFFIRFFSDLCPTRAASLTFTTLLSIVPLAIFIFYLLSFFPALQMAGGQLEQFILQHFVASSATALSMQLHDFVVRMHTLSWAMVISLISIGLLMIFNIVSAVNGVWHVRMHRDSAIVFVLSLVTLCVGPIVFSILLLASSYLTSLPLFSHAAQMNWIRGPFDSLLPMIIEWVAFSFFHWSMPSCRVNIRYALIAGLITTVLFEIAKWCFVAYFHYFPTYQILYGALASIPIFFLWVYISWLIIIAGVLICQLLQSQEFLRKN